MTTVHPDGSQVQQQRRKKTPPISADKVPFVIEKIGEHRWRIVRVYGQFISEAEATQAAVAMIDKEVMVATLRQ